MIIKGGFILTNLYAVHAAPSIFSVIEAESEEVAFDIFATNQIENEFFNEYISEFTINAGLLEKFYKDDEGSFFDSHTGDLPDRIKKLDQVQQNNHIHSWIKKNVNQFWSDKPQFADEYLKELDKNSRSNEPYTSSFSKGFWISTIKKIIQTGTWYDNFEIVKIDLTKNNYQLIYEW